MVHNCGKIDLSGLSIWADIEQVKFTGSNIVRPILAESSQFLTLTPNLPYRYFFLNLSECHSSRDEIIAFPLTMCPFFVRVAGITRLVLHGSNLPSDVSINCAILIAEREKKNKWITYEFFVFGGGLIQGDTSTLSPFGLLPNPLHFPDCFLRVMLVRAAWVHRIHPKIVVTPQTAI